MLRQLCVRLADHPAERDAVIGVGWLVLGTVLIQFGGYGLWSNVALFHGTGWVFLLTTIAFAGIATQRSKHPLLALTSGLAVASFDLAGGGSLLAVLALTDLIYAAVKYVTDRGLTVLLGMAIAWVAAVALALLVLPGHTEVLLSVALQWAVIFSISGLWGWNVRSERVRTSARLGSQHARETQQLRARVAHDLHDLVANQIAVAGLHIEAAKLQANALTASAGAAGPLSGEALQLSLERAKRGTDQAHAELRRLIGALGAIDEIAETPPGSIHDAIDALAEILPGERRLIWVEGSRTLATQELSAADPTQAALTLRILRELVANSAKHGGGNTRCTARMGTAGDGAPQLRLTLTNTVRTGTAGNEAPGNRLGLRGIAHVLNGFGGHIETAADPQTGEWDATIVIPRAALPSQNGTA